jgi:hypothetical protein
MYTAKINSDLMALLYARARREKKKVDQLINELLQSTLWNEPGVLFKGKYYRVEPDMFGLNTPLQEEKPP